MPPVPAMQLLYLINSANSDCGVSSQGKTDLESHTVQGTHLLHLVIFIMLLLVKMSLLLTSLRLTLLKTSF